MSPTLVDFAFRGVFLPMLRAHLLENTLPARPRASSILLRTVDLVSVIITPRKALSCPDEAQGNADVLKMFCKPNINNQSVLQSNCH